MAGRPTEYRVRYCKDAAKLCALGATDEQLADFFNVERSTISLWKSTHAEFSDAIKEAKANLDAQVEKSLFHRAMGYSHPDTHFSSFEGEVVETPTVKHYPPDPVSCIFWLKNRQPAKWRDAVRIEQTINGKVEIQVSEKEVMKELADRGVFLPC